MFVAQSFKKPGGRLSAPADLFRLNFLSFRKTSLTVTDRKRNVV